MNILVIVCFFVLYVGVGAGMDHALTRYETTLGRKNWATLFLWPIFAFVLLIKGLIHLAIGAWEVFCDLL